MDWMSCNCAFLYDFNVELSVVFSISNIFRSVESWNVEKYLFYRVPFLPASGGGGLVEVLVFSESGCDETMSLIGSTFPGVETWKIITFLSPSIVAFLFTCARLAPCSRLYALCDF